jgi:L,D-transpeptidase ErfK/SrfK
MTTFSKYVAHTLTVLGMLCSTQIAIAATFALPPSGNSIIGKTQYISASPGETLTSIGKRFDVGLNEMVDANEGINPMQPLMAGTSIHIPSAFLLPALPAKGIIINLPEMRMYYYPQNSQGIVMTYPIGIGKVGKTIPIRATAVTRKTLNPTWTPPQDIREFNEQQGIILPQTMPAGPDNPLGPYAIYLTIPTYLIHSTIYPESVGRRASFGCIRMHVDDIKNFYPLVTPRTPVMIVDMPNKIGWQGNHLYAEAHEALEEHKNEPYAGMAGMVTLIDEKTKAQPAIVDWQLLSYLEEEPDGLPHEVGVKIR